MSSTDKQMADRQKTNSETELENWKSMRKQVFK